MSIITAVDAEQVPSQPVKVGAELAQQFDEELVVLHVMSQDLFDTAREEGIDVHQSLADIVFGYGGGSSNPLESGGGDTSDSTPYSLSDAEDDAADVARNVTEETLDDMADLSITFQGRVGEPTQEILGELDRRDARYLVIGGRKRTAVGKALFGSTTQSLLLNADVPVVTSMSS